MSLLERLAPGPAASPPAALSDATFEALRRFVHERTGIYFRDNKRYLLEGRVGRRVAALGLPGFEAYLQALRNGLAERELPALIDAVTINETYFFRHAEQHTRFVEELLPTLVEERLRAGQPRVRLWSTACSTGDEPYTLALLIRERLAPRYPHVRFELTGSDISTGALARAREGRYTAYAVRHVPPELLARYFRREDGPRGETFVLDPTVRAAVAFRRLNLVDPADMRQLRDVDAAFCANVLIYFDEEARRRAVAHLYDALRPGGYLLVGPSETLYGVTQAFRPVRFGQTVAYRKEGRAPLSPPGPA